MSAHLTHEELTDNLLGVWSLTVNAHLLNLRYAACALRDIRTTLGSASALLSELHSNYLDRDAPGNRPSSHRIARA